MNKLRSNQINYHDTLPRNILTNPDFEIWQRGAGPFTTTDRFTADEWYLHFTGGGTASVARNSSPKTGNYALAVTTTLTTGQALVVEQSIENYKSYEGLWMTFSCWVKTSNANAFKLDIWDYNGTNESVASPYHTGSGNWERLTATKQIRTGLIPHPGSVAHGYSLLVDLNIVEMSGTATIDGASLVVGKYPYGVEFVPPTPADDLMRCERYYQTGRRDGEYSTLVQDAGLVNLYGQDPVDFRTPMVAIPVITTSVSGINLYQDAASGGGVTAGDQANWTLTPSNISTKKFRGHFQRLVIASRSTMDMSYSWTAEVA